MYDVLGFLLLVSCEWDSLFEKLHWKLTMYSRSLSTTSRNHRAKGIIKVKHILKICLLAAICFWLIYQVKPSREKEKEIDGKEAKLASEMQSSSEILRLGRKDVSRATETIIDAKLHEEENRHAEEERASVESRIDDREEEEDVDKPEEDKIDDEVQDDLLLDEDKVTDEDDDDDDSERKDHDPDNMIVQEYVSSENPTVLRELNDQSQRSNNLTESESKQSKDMNQLDVKTHSNFTRNFNISSKASLGSSGEVNLPLAENITGATETKADDDDSTDMEEPLDYSGYAFA